ncbi:magnesium transporter NIPA-domain-containing protein [Mycena vulgaris]|nr:magnesium transporter NIPA-domain-containing protein [Mycena vulgaris]
MKLSSYVALASLQFLAVQAAAVPACDDGSGEGCSLPAAEEIFADLAKNGWAVYLVAQPPGPDPTAASASLARPAASLIAAHLPIFSGSATSATPTSVTVSSSSSVNATPSTQPSAPPPIVPSPPSIAPPATSSGAPSTSGPIASPKLKILGIILAVASGLLIGSSFVFKKKGLLRSQAAGTAGEGVKYLKSPLWWLGMSMMILGELCNFAAYAFVEAIVVTPLGALSVVVCTILSSIFLKEKLSLLGWLGCALCILGATVIALNAPKEATVGQIVDFQKLFTSIIFLVYVGVLLVASLVIIFVLAPRYGKTNMLWYILVCSMIGGISVSVTTGLGAAIVTTAGGDNQFKHWFIYVLIVVVLGTLVAEVYYLNVALALFNTAMVTPTYYVIFTFFSIVTTLVLFRGLSASISSVLTLVMGFLVICVGIVILQISKSAHERNQAELQRQSTLLAWSPTEVSEKKASYVILSDCLCCVYREYQSVRSLPVQMEKHKEDPPLANTPEPFISAPRGSLGLTLAGIIQAWRYGVDSDESPDSSEVDIGDVGMIDEYEDDGSAQSSYELGDGWFLRSRADVVR